MVTSGGAKVFLKEDEIGEVKEGYKADLSILKLDFLNLTPISDQGIDSFYILKTVFLSKML